MAERTSATVLVTWIAAAASILAALLFVVWRNTWGVEAPSEAVVVAPSIMAAPASCEPSAAVERVVTNILRCECVDLTGDRVPDFIVMEAAGSGEHTKDYLGRESWIESGGRILLRQDRWSSDYAYRWFANLDADPLPELILAHGFTDGIDYTIERLDVEAGALRVLFHFEPVLIGADGRKCHGYPWDLRDIRVRREGGRAEILSGMTERGPSGHEMETDNAGRSESQHRLPRIVFDGESTQPEIARLEEFETAWHSLEDLRRLSFE